LGAGEQQERWRKFLHEDREQGFDFRSAPLLRLALFRISDDAYYFAWSSHHVLLDGWSVQTLAGDLFHLYEGYRLGRAVKLEKASLYGKYIGWLQAQDEKHAEAFWREELKGFREPTHLWIEGRQGEEPQYEQERMGLGLDLTTKLEEAARQQQVTVNTLVQGGWAVLLGR